MVLMHGDHPPVRRVLMTADCVGGVWSYATDLASGLQARGVHVTVAVMGPALSEARREDARRRGLDVVEGPYRLEWMPSSWDDVDRAGGWLLSLAERLEPDVIHLNGFCHAALPWPAPVMVAGHSCVRTWWRGVHGTGAPAEWNEYTDRVSEGLSAADVVVTPTMALLDGLHAEYGDVPRSRVIPNGSRAVSAHLESSSKEPLVLAAGRLWDEAKNIEALCAAASGISWPTFVAGDPAGPSGTFGGSGAVHWLGPLAPDELQQWYQRAAIYALPARYEPFGLSVLEAAAAGCALVLGDIRTLRENWDGAALFVPPDNRRALARAIESLIHDDDQREWLASRARERSARFTVETMTDGYLEGYDDLLAPADVT